MASKKNPLKSLDVEFSAKIIMERINENEFYR